MMVSAEEKRETVNRKVWKGKVAMKKNLRALSGLMFTAGLITAQAAVMAPPEIVRLSRVETVVTDLGNGFYHYSYVVWNDSERQRDPGNRKMWVWPQIIGWEIPLDSPGVVTAITAPPTWDWQILSAEEYVNLYGVENPFDALYVLQWYDAELIRGISRNKRIVPTGYNAFFAENQYEPSADGFGFISPLAPVDGPYAAVWFDRYRQLGDPPLPGGGTTGGGLPYTPRHQMPDGGTTAVLLGLSLIGLQIWRRSR